MQDDRNLENSDCLVVVILTHGEKDDFLLAKGGKYHLYEFLKIFSPSEMRSMVGKPKIFIIQACRGDDKDKGVELCYAADNTNEQIYAWPDKITCPEFADMLIVMSSHYGELEFI